MRKPNLVTQCWKENVQAAHLTYFRVKWNRAIVTLKTNAKINFDSLRISQFIKYLEASLCLYIKEQGTCV